MEPRRPKPSAPVVWRPYWHEALRSVKRAFLGRNKVRCLGRTFIVAYEARGLTEESDYAVISSMAQGKKCAFDIGANVGLTTLVLASSIADSGMVYSFEASEAACLTVRENILLNGLDSKVQIVNCLLADRSGRTAMFDWNNVAGNASVVIDAPSRTPKIPLAKCTLCIDDFVVQHACEPDFIKIDVEGSECLVLAGMVECLRRHRPVVFVEVHAWPEMSLTEHFQRLRHTLGTAAYSILDFETQEDITDSASGPWEEGSPLAPHCRRWAVLQPKDGQFQTNPLKLRAQSSIA